MFKMYLAKYLKSQNHNDFNKIIMTLKPRTGFFEVLNPLGLNQDIINVTNKS